MYIWRLFGLATLMRIHSFSGKKMSFPENSFAKNLCGGRFENSSTRCVLSVHKRRTDTEDYNRYHTRTCVGCSGCSTPRFHRILPARGFQDEMRGFGDTMRGFGDTASRVLVTSLVVSGRRVVSVAEILDINLTALAPATREAGRRGDHRQEDNIASKTAKNYTRSQ